ncbi:FHA and PrsW-protease domain-containing protein [Ktedonobacteria bacterium brp13]|nr:FHA and PrsW-protease domain-containing protein [Ktedonobacteria bacterium brp13]
MSLSQNYGVLRVIHGHTLHTVGVRQSKYAIRWFSEEQQVCLLTSRETTIGRALSNDCILIDPSISRVHARLVLDPQGWSVYNLTEQNVLQVNEEPLPAGAHIAVHSLDILQFGNTVLQFIAPTVPADLLLTTLADAPADFAESVPLRAPRTDTLDPSSDAHLPSAVSTLPGKDGNHSSDSSDNTCQLAMTALYADIAQTDNAAACPANIADLPLLNAITDRGSPGLHDSLREAALPITTEEKFFGGGITLRFAFHSLRLHKRYALIGAISCFLVLGTVIFMLLSNTLGISTLIHDNPTTLLTVLLVPVIAALGISVLVSFVDRYEREPWYLRLAAFFWGAIIAIPPTVFIEQSLEVLRPMLLGSSNSNILNALFTGLNAGVTEETVKGLGVMLLFIVLRDEFDNVTDGIVYGALIGAGFAMVENILYFAGSPKTFLFLLVSRIVLGWLNHSTFTICFGAALGYIRHTRVRWQHIVIPLLGYLVSVSLHTVFDFVNSYANALALNNPDNVTIVRFSMLASIGDYILLLMVQVVIIFILIKSLAHEASIIREFLTSEVSSGTVYVEEYALLQHSFLRARVERDVLWHYGLRQWFRVRALYQTEIGLAFRKWHVSMGDKPKLGYLQPEDAYRQRIQRLRQVIAAAEERA